MALKRFLAAVLLALGLAHGASAQTIYFAGGEDIDFVQVTGSLGVGGGGSTFRSGYANTTVALLGSTADPPTNATVSPNFGSISSLWFHTQFTASSGTGVTTANSQLMSFYGSDGVRRLSIRGTGTAGQVKVSTRNTAGTFVDLVTCSSGTFPSTLGVISAFDIQLVYAVAGSITLYKDGVSWCSFAGDVTTNSITAVAQIELAGGAQSGGTGNFSEVIVSDSDTRAMAYQTLKPQAAGTTQQFTPSTVANVAKNTLNDATWVSTPTNNNISDWTIPVFVSGTWTVLAVKQSVRTARGASGPQNFAFSCRPNGQADTASGSTAPTTSFANYSLYETTNCATGVSWAVSDFTGANFGEKALP